MTAGRPSGIQDHEALQAWFGGRIPIVLGTVGHRDLSSTDAKIVRTVRRECRRLRNTYKDSPFLVLSGLAEGADRLVAKIAMEELDARLIAILPFPSAAYAEDFENGASRQEFQSFLDRASATFEISLPENDNWRRQGGVRDRQYACVGAIIAEQSQILMAIWDGLPARGAGGTGDVVSWFSQGYAPTEYSAYIGDLALFDPPHPGLCITIDPTTGEKEYRRPPQARRRFPLTRRRSIDEILARTESYNRDVRRRAARWIRNDPILPADALLQAPIFEATAAYQQADALAVFYANRVKLANWVFYALALAAVFAFGSVDAKPLASWGFLGVMGVMALVALYSWSQSLDTKYLEYRSFAEAMRILFFWRMLGVQEQVWLTYLSKYGPVVRWLRHAVRAVEFTQDRRGVPAISRISDEAILAIAIRYWLRSQVAYYKSASAGSYRRHKIGMWIIGIAIVLTFATSAILAAMTFTHAQSLHSWPADALVVLPFATLTLERFIEQLQVAVSLTAAIGIAARGFLIRSADFELARQYAGALEIYERADIAVSEVPAGDPDQELPGIFVQLGREALGEQAEWLWLRHSRPIEAPPN